MKTTRLVIFAILALTGSAFAANESSLRVSSDSSGIRYSDAYGNVEEPRVYIVQLRSPAAVEQQALAQASLFGTKPIQRQLFSKSNPAAQQYAQKLVQEHDIVLAKAGLGTRKIYSYRYSINGFAASMTPASNNPKNSGL